MDEHLADRALLDSTPGKRQTYSQEVVKAVTDLARHHGGASAARMYGEQTGTKIPEQSARNWLRYYQENHEYWSVKKRGRLEIMTQTEKADLFRGVSLLRSSKKAKSLTSRFVSAAARGIVERSRPAALSIHGGPAKLCRSTAQNYLHKAGYVVKAKTTDRTASEEAIVAAAVPFYAEVSERAEMSPPSCG